MLIDYGGKAFLPNSNFSYAAAVHHAFIGTFGVVVEDTVICACVRVGVPEGISTAAERGKVQHLLLR